MEITVFNQLMRLCKGHVTAIGMDHAKVIVDAFKGEDHLRECLARSEAGDPKAMETVLKFARGASMVMDLRRMGFAGVDFQVAVKLVTAHTAKNVRETIDDAATGDANAKVILGTWIGALDQPDGGDGLATRAKQHPIHATDVPPPQPPMTVEKQPAPTQAPRVPARRSGDDHVSEVSKPHAPSNVHYMDSASHTDDDWRQPAQDTPRTPALRTYDQVQVYGGKTAIQFSRSPAKGRTTTTINIKGAPARDGQRTTNGVDWHNGIEIMLAPHEVQMTLAVMLGYLPKYRAAGHGDSNNKWFQVEETTGDYQGFVRLAVCKKDDRAQNVSYPVNISANDVADVAAILARAACDQLQMRENDAALFALVRRTADLYAKADAARAAKKTNLRNTG